MRVVGVVLRAILLALVLADRAVVHQGALKGETHPYDDYVVHVRAGEVLTIDMVYDPGTPQRRDRPNADGDYKLTIVGG
jgi:hypothetical protein